VLRFRLVAIVALAACTREPAPPVVPTPVRDAVGDADLRMMIAEIATAKACDRIRDRFHALRAADHHDEVTGVLWFRTCSSIHDGTNVTFTLSGSGWQWVEKTTHKAGGTFVVRQYVRFTATAKIEGTLDLGYDSASHVASLWFSPAHPPSVDLEPIGKIDVGHTGTWSSLVGGVGALFARSPKKEGALEAKREGTHQFIRQLSEGLTVTIDLCTGVARSTTGHVPKGELAPPDVLEPSRTVLELQPGGVLLLGPQRAQDGMTVHVDLPGQVEVSLACRDDAEAVSRAYLDGAALPTVPTLATANVEGSTDLTIPAAHCPVAVIARSLATKGPPLQLTVQRSSSEIGWANGGPMVGCAK